MISRLSKYLNFSFSVVSFFFLFGISIWMLALDTLCLKLIPKLDHDFSSSVFYITLVSYLGFSAISLSHLYSLSLLSSIIIQQTTFWPLPMFLIC